MNNDADTLQTLQGALDGGDPADALARTADAFYAPGAAPAPAMWFLRGQVAERATDYHAALHAFLRAADTETPDPTHLFHCGHFLLNTAQPWAAARMFETLDKLVPGNVEIAVALAKAYLDAENYRKSAVIWEKLYKKTKAEDVLVQLALARMLSGDEKSTVKLLDGHPDRYRQLIVALQERGASPEAYRIARKATSLWPSQPHAWAYRGIISADLDNVADALRCHEKALSLNPGDPDFLFNLGTVYAVSGATEKAADAFRAGLAGAPEDIRLLRGLADCIRFTEETDELQTLERLAASNALSTYDRAAVMYCLGKAYDDLKRHGDAMRAYVAGGSARASERQYDVNDEVALMGRIRDLFSTVDLETLASAGHRSNKPVFIVGLPRSGTTLVEQILAGHEQVQGGGELPCLRDAVLYACDGRIGRRALSPWEFATPRTAPGATEIKDIAGRYLKAIDARAPDAKRLIDKQPLNDRYIGFAALAFPDATIVHCMRDLRDTGVSCVSKNFEAEFAFADDPESFAVYARAQRDLMGFWEALFPGRIVAASYEALVGDPEVEARRLVAAIGLDWSDACLDLAGSDRVVKTASAQQVRQDVYRSAVNRWERYLPEIEPMVKLLEGVD